MSKILGISAFYHDSAAALIIDGKIIAAAQEERFSRIKHDSNYPYNAINFVLKFANIKISEVDYITFYEKPLLKFKRLISTYSALAPRGFYQFSKSIPLWLKDKMFQKKKLIKLLKKHDSNIDYKNKIFFSEHHQSHAASAFYPSPFEKAIILTADGVGEWATTTVAIGNKEKLEIVKEIHFPHSLGLLYSAFTYYIGFKVNSGEYKLMGLAPYGKPIYVNLIKDKLVDIKADGSFRLNQEFFNYTTGFTMTNSKFHKLFGAKPRKSNDNQILQFHMDIAASIQKVTEEIMILLTTSLKEEFNISNLCLAGGVALNCVANGKILKEQTFDNIWIQPAAGDAGGSIGSALSLWFVELKNKRLVENKDQMQGSYLGPSFTSNEIKTTLEKMGATFEELDESLLISKTANDLSNGDAVGWFQGRMEFGPRALGGRSILGDSRDPKMQKNLNLKVKFRESFRPFAPSVLREDLSNWFDINYDSPYMLFVANVNKNKKIEIIKSEKELFGIEKLNIKRSIIPAVTHVDYSARIQTVHKDTNRKFYNLIKKFKDITGCPVIVNTSFNVRGEPIVNSIEDAFNCFMGTNLDKLVIENFYLDKKKQNELLRTNYLKKYKLD